MSEFDEKLAAFFAEARPPARDPVFCAAVLEAAARRRLREDMISLSILAACGAVGLAAAWPVISPSLAAVASGLAPAAGAMITALALAWMISRPPAARA